MTSLHPWAKGPFELILHGERHLRDGSDFDRRMALISFDQAVEVSISTYLSLHPVHRNGKTYAKEDVARWTQDYHTKLEFLGRELSNRGLSWEVEKAHIVWVHNHRGEQYHSGSKGTPGLETLRLARTAALWVFSLLYNVPDAEAVLAAAAVSPAPPTREPPFDRAIDNVYGMVDVAGQPYHVSEVLFAVDSDAYRELGSDLCGERSDGPGSAPEDGG